MNKIKKIIYAIYLIGVLFFVSSCNEDNNVDIPELSTTAITDITDVTAISGGNIISDGGSTVTNRGVCWSTNQTPTIEDDKTGDGVGAGVFVSNISGLTANTLYYVRAYATNSAGTAYGSTMSFSTQVGGSGSSFTDSRDGNVYQTTIIGNQVWMAENLKYLPSVVGPSIASESTPYYYVYGYDGTDVNAAKATSNYTTYGALYNWTAVMSGAASSTLNPSAVQGVCPEGWHLPSDAEWTELSDYLGGESVAGGKLKETGTTHWADPNEGATNETGFTALPDGFRRYDGSFYYLGYYGYWWSATEENETNACALRINYDSSNILSFDSDKELGFSVRCVRN